MPGDNCTVFGCRSCTRLKRIGTWQLPVVKDAAHKKLPDDWMSEVTKAHEIDREL